MVVKAGLLFRLPGKVYQLNSELSNSFGSIPSWKTFQLQALTRKTFLRPWENACARTMPMCSATATARTKKGGVHGERRPWQRFFRSWFSISLETIRGCQNAGSQWVYIYIFIIHYYTWYIIYSFFMKGALLTFAVHCFAVFWQDPSHPRYCIADSVACWLVWAKSI